MILFIFLSGVLIARQLLHFFYGSVKEAVFIETVPERALLVIKQ